MSLDVLKKLFERHFHAPPEHIVPLQGELGGSGRKIIRLASQKDRAIGILYGVREENVAFLEFSKHFRRHGLPVPEIYAEDLSHGASLEESCRREHCSSSGRSLLQSCDRVATLSGRSRPRFELQSKLSVRQLRSPVHRLGSELFQVLFSPPRRHLLQRTSPRKRFQPLDRFPPQRPPRLLSLPRLPIPQHPAAQRRSLFRGLSRRSQRRSAI